MRAWIVKELAGISALTQQDIPDPGIADGQLLVRVEAAAINFSDLLMLKGAYQVRPPLPFVPGQEVAGSVVAAAPGTRFKVGDRVASKVTWGAFADLAVVHDDMAIGLPDEMDWAEAAAFPVVYPTAHIALHDRGALRAGETVLVHSAAGGVGLAALQLAKAAGARVIATAGGAAKLALCRENGADVAIDYAGENWQDAVLGATEGRGADVIFDPVGGDIADRSLKCLAWRGRLLIVGFASGRIPQIPANRLLLRNASAVGVYWSHDKDAALIEQVVADLVSLVRAGRLKLHVTHRYGFGDLPKALSDLAERRTSGKLVLLRTLGR